MSISTINSIGDFDRDLDTFMNNYQRFGLVVVDTASELQRYQLAGQLALQKRMLPQQQDWNVALLRMEQLARAFRALPLHVVWLCHEMQAVDADSGRNVFRPAFQGQFGTLMYHKHFDVIGRVFLHEHVVVNPATNQPERRIQRYLSCAPNPYWETKDRSGSIPEYWPIPTEEEVLAGALPGIDFLIASIQQRSQWVIQQRYADQQQAALQPSQPGAIAYGS